MKNFDIVNNICEDHIKVVQLVNKDLKTEILHCLEVICGAIDNYGKLILVGNGGSAADAQHIAAEFTGRFRIERNPLPAIALTTDTSALTAIGNDYGFDAIFSRQLHALGNAGDVLLAISTSGNSPNILNAVKSARKLHIQSIGLTGMGGGRLKDMCDRVISIPSSNTARIQEAHILIGHIFCELVDQRIARNSIEHGMS